MSRPGSGNREGERIICPIYICYREKEIWCQAHVPEASATVIRYRNRTGCEKQMALFCEGEWERCEHYRAWKHFMWEDE